MVRGATRFRVLHFKYYIAPARGYLHNHGSMYKRSKQTAVPTFIDLEAIQEGSEEDEPESKKPRLRFRNVCFTSYEKEPPKFIPEKESYLIYQRENNKTYDEKTPGQHREHWQGYVEFKSGLDKLVIQRLLGDTSPDGSLHIERRKGTSLEAAAYCRKDDTACSPLQRAEYGKLSEQGRDSQFNQACTEIITGVSTALTICESDPRLYHTYGRTFEACERINSRRRKCTNILTRQQLNPMQQLVLEMVLKPADDRTVVWLYDTIGGAGKSALIRYLVMNHKATMLGSSYKDSIDAYNNEPIVCFDIERSLEEKYVPYHLFEALKNGCLFSGKFHGVCKTFTPPHVIIFANRTPNLSMLSGDRWKMINIDSISSIDNIGNSRGRVDPIQNINMFSEPIDVIDSACPVNTEFQSWFCDEQL